MNTKKNSIKKIKKIIKTDNKKTKEVKIEQNTITKIAGKKHKEKSKFRIMQSAAEFFATKGFDSTSIREICADADANVCMVSYFWGGKKALYESIINDLIDKQSLYAKKYMDLNKDVKKLSKNEQIELLYDTADKIIDFLYGGWISDTMFRFLLQEQQNKRIELKSPIYNYFRKVMAYVLDKKINDKEVILKTLFIISQINSPKILPVFSLDLLKQKEYTNKDVKIIRDNVKLYMNTIIEGINK